MNIQWYPGHMTKAKRQMQEDIKLIDIVIELLDARAPGASRNPDINTLANGKSRLVLLNKQDLADPAVNALWTEYFKSENVLCYAVDARKNNDMKPVMQLIEQACKEKTERDRKRGILNRPIRAMIVGIPNVGKSTFINSFAKKACTKVGNKPGVTKGKQWIRLSKNVELLDTPGILWPKFEDPQVGMRLAQIGSVNDDVIELYELSLDFIAFLQNNYCKTLADSYNIEVEGTPDEVLARIAMARNCLKKGGEADSEKASKLLLDDFRSGRLGRISLEKPVTTEA